MTTINRKQPMRTAEIDLLNQVDTNTGDIETNRKNLAQEVINRTNADTALGNRITQETIARTQADTQLQANIDTETNQRKAADTQLQTNLGNEVTRAKAAEVANSTAITNEVTRATTAEQTLTTNLGNEVTRAKAAEVANANSITSLQGRFPIQTDDIGVSQVTNAKLEYSIQQQLTFLQTVPAMEFGTSNSVDVSANSNVTVDVTFGSTKTKAPIVLCGLQHTSGNLSCIVTGVTNQQFSVTVYNLSSTAVSGVTIDWLAISGR